MGKLLILDEWLFVPDVQARYKVSSPTARKIIRKCEHIEQPKLAVSVRALAAYEADMNREPNETKPKRKRASGWKDPPRDANGNYYLPRRRA